MKKVKAIILMLTFSIFLIALSIVSFYYNANIDEIDFSSTSQTNNDIKLNSNLQEIEVSHISNPVIQNNYISNNQEEEDTRISEAGRKFIDYLKSKYTGDVHIEASYIDGSKNLDEMLQKADIIVKGIVNGVKEERLFGILFTFDIEKVIKGEYKKDDTITVLTLKGIDQLIEGETYVLALGKDYEENTFHVMAGDQGRFSLEDDNIKYKDTNFKDDIDKAMASNSNKDLSPLDMLCDDFSKRVNDQNGLNNK